MCYSMTSTVEPLFKLNGQTTNIDYVPLPAAKVSTGLALLITLRLVLSFDLEYSSNNRFFLGVDRKT